MAKNTQSLAKEIRKEGESWPDALARAKEMRAAEKAGETSGDSSGDEKSSEESTESESNAQPNKSKKAAIKGPNSQKKKGTKAKKSDLKPGKANAQKAAGSRKAPKKAEKPEFAVYQIKQATGARNKDGGYMKKDATIVRSKSLMTVTAADAMNEAFESGMNTRFCVLDKDATEDYKTESKKQLKERKSKAEQ